MGLGLYVLWLWNKGIRGHHRETGLLPTRRAYRQPERLRWYAVDLGGYLCTADIALVLQIISMPVNMTGGFAVQ